MSCIMKDKYSSYPNFQIVNADFETYSFDENRYDFVYSAAAIQWIPEEVAFTKIYRMLKPGIRKAIMNAGNHIVIIDTIPLYLVQKP